jgi:hypothetical protein
MSFLLSMLSIMMSVTTEIRWKNDTLFLALHDNVDDYRFLPEASLWINGSFVHDPLMYYERNGVEWTFISTVNTAVVRSYTIKYKVYFPTYNVSQTKSILFVVEDRIPPTITKTPDFRLPLGSKMPDLKDGLVYLDNYNKASELIVTVQSSQVILTRVGIYQIRYQVTDQSGNRTESLGSLEIYDHLPPEITVKKALIISFGDLFKVTDYFTIKDNYDTILTIVLDDQHVNYQALGSYPISITAKDQSGLETKVTEELTIIDTKPPTLIMRTIPKVIPIYQTVHRETLLAFVLSVKDDVDQMSESDIEIITDIESDTLGTYAVYYMVSDRSGNKTSIKLNVSVQDLEPPVIWSSAPLMFDVFSIEPHLLSWISVSDNHAHPSSIIIKMTGTFKMNVVGSYPVTFTATDPSGNTATLRTYVEIKDRIPPVILQSSDIIITEFARKILNHFFTFTDQYTPYAGLSIWIEDEQVDYETIGVYSIRACAKDTSGNVSCLDTDLIIADILEPELVLKAQMIYAEVNQAPLDLREWIQSVSDQYDVLDPSMVEISSLINYQKPGRYPVIFSIKDSSYNHQVQTLVVIVDDNTPPIIKATPITIIQYDAFDLFQGVEAYDDFGVVTIIASPETIDTSKAGTYVIVYTAIDSRGNYTTLERLLTIEPVEKKYDINAFIPMIIMILLGSASLYVMYKKMS